MKKIPFLFKMIRGAIGKKFVVKHYKGGRIVVTRFPDMKGIVASGKQRVRRNLFKEAVVYAKWIIADKQRKEAFKKSLPRKKRGRVYQAAIQLYMKGEQLAMSNRQLAMKAVVRREEGAIDNRQLAKGNRQLGDYVQMGPWKVLWQKRMDSFVLAEQRKSFNFVQALLI